MSINDITNKFDIDLLNNPLSLRNSIIDIDNNSNNKLLIEKNKTLRDHIYNGQIFKFKEQILLNNLPLEYIEKNNIDCLNTFYYKKYYKFYKDFDTKSFKHLMKMREKYLNQFIEVKEIQAEEKEKNEIIIEKTSNNNYDNSLLILFTNLYNILKIVNNEPNDKNIGNSIIIILLNDILLIVSNEVFPAKYYNEYNEVEIIFNNIIDEFVKNFFDKKQKIEKISICIFQKMQEIALYFKSAAIFIKLLDILQKNNIFLNNYKSLYDQHFKKKFSIENLIKFNNSEDIIVLNLTNNITFSDMTADSNYLYLCINCDIKYKILKINLQKKKFFLESVLKDEISTTGNMIKLLIDNKNEELIIFSIEKENKNSYLYFYDKNNLTLKKTKTIKIPFSYSKSEEIIQGIFTSISKFFIYTTLNIYSVDINSHQVLPEFKEQFNISEKINNNYFFILNEYVVFQITKSLFRIYDIIKKNTNEIKIDDSEMFSIHSNKDNKDINHYFFDIFNNCLYKIINNEKNGFQIKKQSNVNLALINNININLLDQININISTSYNKLKSVGNKYNDELEEKEINPVIKYLFNYNNNFDKIYENQKDDFYTNSPLLSQKYVDFFYMCLIKYFIYYGNKKTILNKDFPLNFTNDLLFDIIKNKIIQGNFDNNDINIYFMKIILLLFINYSNINKKLNNEDQLKINKLIDVYKDLKTLFQFCLKYYLDNQICLDIIQIINKNIDFQLITNDLFNEIKGKLKTIIPIDLKITFFKILISKGNVENEFLNIFFQTERDMIFSDQEQVKQYLIQKNFIDLKRFYIEVISDKIFKIDLNEISKPNNIFSILKEEFIILLNKYQKSKNISMNLFNNSSVCKLFLFILNAIYVRAKKENFDIISYLSFLENPLKILENLPDNEIIDIPKIEEIILETDHPIINEKTISYNFSMASKKDSNENINIVFDPNSYINDNSKIKINNLGPFNTYIPNNVMKLNSQINANIQLDYKKSNDESTYDYGIKLKISNQILLNDNDNIFTMIRRTIIFSICDLLYNQINKNKINKEIEINKFFGKILIDKNMIIENKPEMNIFSNQEDIIKFENILNKKKLIYPKDLYEDILNKIENDEYKIIFTNLLPPKKELNEYKQKLLKFFFKIILKKNNLLKEFDKLSKNPNDEKELKDLFKSIYTEIIELLEPLTITKKNEEILNMFQNIQQIIFIDEHSNINKNQIKNDINTLIFFISEENLNIDKIKSILNQNGENLIKKRNNLSILNRIFPYLIKSQDIKDFIYFYNKIIKGSDDIVFSINKILKGSDIKIGESYKKEIYIFFYLICEKLYTKKLYYDLSTNIKLLQSLFWKFKSEDFEIIYYTKLFDIITNPSNFICDILLKFNNAFNKDVDDTFYNTYKISIRTLYIEIFNLFSILSLTIFKQLKKDNSDLNKFYADKICNIINLIVMDYLKKIKEFIKRPCGLMNEEKLNSFLLILFRGINDNKHLISILQEKYFNIFSYILEIFILSSERNKYISLKIIEILIFYEKFLDSLNIFINSLESNKDFFDFIFEKKNPLNLTKYQIIFKFFINYSILLQQNKYLVSFYTIVSQSDLNISFQIINLFRYIISNKNNSTIKNEMITFIENNIMNNDYLLTFLLILGVDIYNFGIGSKIFYNPQKNGIVIGFTEMAKQIFNFSKNKIDDDLYAKFQNFLYLNSEYSYVILEDNIKKEEFKSLSFEIALLKTKNIELIIGNNIIINNNANNKIIELLLGNFEKYTLKNLYLILRYFKNVLMDNNSFNIILNSNKCSQLMDLLISKSLDEEILKQKCPLIKMETIEKYLLNETLKNNKLSKELENLEKSNQKESLLNSNKKSEDDEMNNSNQPSILMDEKSFFLKFGENGSLIKEFSYLKIFNNNCFQVSNKYLPISRIVNEYNTKPFILILDDINEFSTIFNKNVKYIITGNNFNPQRKSIKDIPIITIENKEFKDIISFIFDSNSVEDFEELFMVSIQKDYSSLIYIPDDMVSDISVITSGDLILKVVGEKKNNQEGIALAKSSEQLSILTSIDINILYSKLISLVSRRLLLIMFEKQKKINLDIKKVQTLVKLLNFENSNLSNDNNNEIQIILNNFLKFICLEPKKNEELIRKFIDYSFLSNNREIISFSMIPKIESENLLVNFNNIEIGLLLINQILKFSEKDKSVIDCGYKIKLFEVLLNELLNSKQSNQDFIFGMIINLLNDINNTFDENMNNLDEISYLFESKEIQSMIEKENNNLEKLEPTPINKNSKDIIINDIDAKLIQITFIYFDLGIKCLSKINLNITKYIDMKIMKYFLYCTLSKYDFEEIEYHIFILFLYHQGLIKLFTDNPIYKPQSKISLNYYDNKYYLPFILSYNKILPDEIYNNTEGIYLILKKLNKEIISPFTNIFLYNNSKCDQMQDYIKQNDKIDIKTIFIPQNRITISFPYTKFHTNLFGCGSNEKQSLGCGGDREAKYEKPQECLGLDDCKNIIDFKFGYFHTFVQSSDNNIFTCGNDSGSSFKVPSEYSSFNLNTHFQDIAQNEGGAKGIWVNNYNASILLTQENNLYGCGMNFEYCLTNAIGPQTVSIPFKLLEIKLKVQEISCGFKSSFFLLEDGTAYTCGSNSFKQCGSCDNVNSYQTYFHLLPPKGGKFTKVVSGEEFFLTLIDENDKIKGRLYSFGSNENGRTGVGLDTSYSLQKVKNVENLEFKTISSRNDNSAAITKNGELYVFGINESGCLGLGNRTSQYTAKRVKALKNYICDDVGISHNHMIIVSRNKSDCRRFYSSSGTTEYKALALEQNNDNNNVHKIYELPTEITFFENEKKNEVPIRVSVSRYQSYFMTMNCSLNIQLVKEMEVNCVICNQKISEILYFIFEKPNNINYYCDKCIKNENKFCSYVTNIIYDKINYDLDILKEKNENYIFESEDDKNNKSCLCCKENINDLFFISTINQNLILCKNCYYNKCHLIEFPQIFYACKNCLPKFKKENNISNEIYKNTKKSTEPYIEFDVLPQYKSSYELGELLKDKQLKEVYEKNWKTLKDKYLHELHCLEEDFKNKKLNNKLTEEEINDKSNLSMYCNKMKLFGILQKIKEDKDDISKINFPNLLNLNENDFHLLFEMSEVRMQSLLYVEAIRKNLSSSINLENFFTKSNDNIDE